MASNQVTTKMASNRLDVAQDQSNFLSICEEEEIVPGVYKGTLGSAFVSIRRNRRCEDSVESASAESLLHDVCDDGLSSHALRCHGFSEVGDYVYVCFQRFECSLPQAVAYSVGIADGSIPAGSGSLFLQTHFGNVTSTLMKQIIKQMIEGVQHLHKKSIRHRNLSAHSFILVSNGVELMVKVDDLALGVSGNHTGIGTPTLLAPEQYGPNPCNVFKNDSFNLGCAVSFVLTGGELLFENIEQFTYSGLALQRLEQRYPDALSLVYGLTKQNYQER